MNILISCYDFGAPAALVSQQARSAVLELVRQGHAVTVLTNSDYRYAGEDIHAAISPLVRVLEIDCYAEIAEPDENLLLWNKMIPGVLYQELQDGDYEKAWHICASRDDSLLLWIGPFSKASHCCPMRQKGRFFL